MAYSNIARKLEIIREVRETRPVQIGTGTGHTSTPVGMELVQYDVELDWAAVQQMAERAAKSKGQRSVDGPLRVTVTRRRKVQPK